MNDVVIRAERLSKSYKLYDAPRYRLLDMLGFKRAGDGVRQRQALCDLSFEVRRGEKVGIIGRNGAGKSTLLKLISQVITPTSGSLEVRGETRALLSIGAGFHPDFTGRENVVAYLASLGFVGAELDELVEQAISFAELEDYADQPLKSYSTGMAMRIMFSAATMIKPDLFVIDEVLGVGDAYFQQKSFKHISEICAAGQTTLLLVTHDVYSAAQLCNRMLWLDRGRLLIDGPPDIVVRAYQDSIREQEERRLRAKTLAARGGGQVKRVLVEIRSEGNRPPPAPLHIAVVSVSIDGVRIATAPMTDLAFGGDGTSYLVAEGSNWGEPEWIDGRLARPLRTYGSPFHKVAAAFHLDLKAADWSRLGVHITARTEVPGRYVVCVHTEHHEQTLGALDLEPARWCETSLAANAIDEPREASAIAVMQAAQSAVNGASTDPAAATAPGGRTEALDPNTPDFVAPSVNVDGRYGGGDVEIIDLRALDHDGVERHLFPAGRRLTLLLDYRLRRPDLRERLTIVLAFKRDGVTDVTRLLCDTLQFDAQASPRGTVMIDMSPCPLGVGRYAITVLIAKEGYFRERQSIFFAVNPAVYDVRSSALEIEIEDTDTAPIYSGTGAVIDARWSVHTESQVPAPVQP